MSADWELDAMALIGALVAGDTNSARHIAAESDSPETLAVFVGIVAKSLLTGWTEALHKPADEVWQQFSAMTVEHLP